MNKNFFFVLVFVAAFAGLHFFRGRLAPAKTEFVREIRTATDLNFEEAAGNAEWVLVDFWAPWCGPCRRLKPTLNELAIAFRDRLQILAVNVDIAPRTSQSFQVTGIPNLVLLHKGSVVDRRVGAASFDELEAWLNRHL